MRAAAISGLAANRPAAWSTSRPPSRGAQARAPGQPSPADVERLGKRDEALGGDRRVVGQPAVGEDADRAPFARASLGVSPLALVAAAAVQRGLHRVDLAVDGAGELVAKGVPRAAH